MSPEFDPYQEWLGIVADQRPPDHYSLLGLRLFESDPNAIRRAANERMRRLRENQFGVHRKESQRLLNEVAAARVCLLEATEKSDYDADLKASLDVARLSPLPEQIEKIRSDDLPMRTPDHLRSAVELTTGGEDRLDALPSRRKLPLRASEWGWWGLVGIGCLAIILLIAAILSQVG